MEPMKTILIGVLLGAALAHPQAALHAQQLKNPFGLESDVALEGKKLYDTQGCVACHGNNARGAVGPDLTDDEWLRAPSDEMIFNVIKNGRAGTLMSPFRDAMSDEQIWKLVTYLRDENRKRKPAQ
jgi:mono/diheme cytochrome c family protein